MSVLREDAARADLPQTPGLRHLRRYLAGERLTQRQAILAKCNECCGYYIDGRKDCGVVDCSLHPFMPYRNKHTKGTP
jgi:hypothetical protein